MQRMKISIIDLVSGQPASSLYARAMNANFASIMPQVTAVWCEELGHQVRFTCCLGSDDIRAGLTEKTDILIISAFTHSAQLAYAISNLYRQHGAVTVLGGPHARCYPEDASLYFDYVLGLTDKKVIEDLLADAGPHRPVGRQLTATKQPKYLPGVRERWKFIEATIARAHGLKLIPMLGSTGCPYTCSFCIDSVVPYQTLGFDQMREDLRFLQGRLKRPCVAWHDPNFGVRFDDYLSAIEEAVPAGSIDFIAESSLSLLSEPHLARLKKNGFIGMLPGIESWYSHGNKSRSGVAVGMDKVEQIAGQINTVLRYIPYVQTNFVLGLDCDYGPEPFELTKRFLDLAPGAYPAFSLLTAYGRAAPQNLEFQADDRVFPLPFHFLNNTYAMNVRIKNYQWPEFFGYIADLTGDAHSWSRIARRTRAAGSFRSQCFSAIRSLKTSKQKRYLHMQGMLQENKPFRKFFDGETQILPDFFRDKIRQDLGAFREFLPPGAMMHDHLAYLRSQAQTRIPARRREAPAKVAL